MDGILGMAWPGMDQQGMSVVFQEMIEQEVVDEPVFGFYLNRYMLMHLQGILYRTCTVVCYIQNVILCK